MSTAEQITMKSVVDELRERATAVSNGSDGSWLDREELTVALTWSGGPTRDHGADAGLVEAFGPDVAAEVADLLDTLNEQEYLNTAAQRAAFRLSDTIAGAL